jgi:hypothetical protein
MRIVNAVMLGLLTVIAAACGGAETPPSSAPGAGAPAAAPANAPDRVFFVSPTNGATIKPMSTIEFGSSGKVTVAAVPPGELKPEQVRPGMIHYHIAVDTDCLPAGAVIPKADPWVHFGDGKKVIEMSLTPGPHRLTVQAGDDMHRTIAGLCETINVTVAQ